MTVLLINCMSIKRKINCLRPSKKKKNWLASLFLLLVFLDSDVLMLKYSKTYPYLLSFLHPSVQEAYYIINKIILERRKHMFSDN